jgi:hypothetical protein
MLLLSGLHWCCAAAAADASMESEDSDVLQKLQAELL